MNWHEIRARRNYPQYLVSKKGGFLRLACRSKKPLGEGAPAYEGHTKAPL
jgi:hypothetical protein